MQNPLEKGQMKISVLKLKFRQCLRPSDQNTIVWWGLRYMSVCNGYESKATQSEGESGIPCRGMFGMLGMWYK